MLQTPKSLLFAAIFAGFAARAEAVDLRFYGDVYVPQHILARTGTTPDDPVLFRGMRDLLDDSLHNIVNFEGVATDAFIAHEPKRYLLRMPPTAPAILKAAGVNVATLANNHSMDFGYQGLFDTLVGLHQAGIEHTGAGANFAAAVRPVILAGESQTYCLLAFSKTLPESFWAGNSHPGTAVADVSLLMRSIDGCVAQGFAPIVSLHWGQENMRNAQSYQKDLAHQAIDHGARLVVGHHPHVLQEFEVYKNRPILYSIGNFAFGTAPSNSRAEGLAVGLKIERGGRATTLVLTPIVVNTRTVDFRPRPLREGEPDPMIEHMPAEHPCIYGKGTRQWVCTLEDSES